MAECINFRAVNKNWEIFIECDIVGSSCDATRTLRFASIATFGLYDSWVLTDKKMWDETWKWDILDVLTDHHRLEYDKSNYENFWKEFTRKMKDTFLKEGKQ